MMTHIQCHVYIKVTNLDIGEPWYSGEPQSHYTLIYVIFILVCTYMGHSGYAILMPHVCFQDIYISYRTCNIEGEFAPTIKVTQHC